MYSEAVGKGKSQSAAGQSTATGGLLKAPKKTKQSATGQTSSVPSKAPAKIKQPEAGGAGAGGCIGVCDGIRASAGGGSITGMCIDCVWSTKAAGSTTTGASGFTETAKYSTVASTSRAIEAAEAVTSAVIKEAGEVASRGGGSNTVTAATPDSVPKGPEVYDIKEVAKSFITSYYKVLQNGPQYLFRFHGEDTEFCHGSIQLPGVVGIEKIKERLTLLNYDNSRVEIRSLDAFESVNKTITVLVLGQMTIKYANWRPFVHTMILVLREPNTQKYYLKTDSLRFLI